MRYEDVKRQIDTIEGYMGSEAQREFMFNLAKITNVAAEIGSYKGLSAAIVSLGMQSADNLTGVYYCIDTFESSNEELSSGNTYATFCENMLIIKDHHVFPVIGYSYDSNVLKKIPNDLDWIYIDGDHSTESVYSDILHYHSKVKKNGLMLFHDHTWESVLIGVKKAVNDGIIELVTSFDDFGVYKVI